MDNLNVKVEVASLMQVPISNWRTTLARECNVYICEEGYIAKRFDQIHYKFVDKLEAKEIIIDNLYALLRFKYFRQLSEKIDNQIKKIVSNFVQNLQTSIQRISFINDSQCVIKKMLPDNCIAFRNGVYDFKNNKWLFKYDIYSIDNQRNRIYQYDYDYIITWYVNTDYEPHRIADVNETLTKYQSNPNLMFKLIYNMSFDSDNNFSIDKFTHLCQVMGYTLLQSFSDKFVCLVGNGSNGKTCLFESILADRIVPRPSYNDHSDIENNKYIINILKNKHINLALSSDMLKQVKVLKSLTGSMYQSIEAPHKALCEGIVNCKYIFSSTNYIRFNDDSEGFNRRLNTYRIYYRWDKDKYYLERGKYYDVKISDSLEELRNDESLDTYIELSIIGLKSATSDFTKGFEFLYNNAVKVNESANIDIVSLINNISLRQISNYINSSLNEYEKNKDALLDINADRLYTSKYFKAIGISSFQKLLAEMDKSNSLLNNRDYYIGLWVLRRIAMPNVKIIKESMLNQINNLDIISKRKFRYVKVRIENNKLKVK